MHGKAHTYSAMGDGANLAPSSPEDALLLGALNGSAHIRWLKSAGGAQ